MDDIWPLFRLLNYVVCGRLNKLYEIVVILRGNCWVQSGTVMLSQWDRRKLGVSHYFWQRSSSALADVQLNLFSIGIGFTHPLPPSLISSYLPLFINPRIRNIFTSTGFGIDRVALFKQHFLTISFI